MKEGLKVHQVDDLIMTIKSVHAHCDSFDGGEGGKTEITHFTISEIQGCLCSHTPPLEDREPGKLFKVSLPSLLGHVTELPTIIERITDIM